ncbi:MAG: hypothetical protein LBK13_10920 [Spirochaetales bacterium]|jgi:hypothetical protein|nr:hypothetical protein [Spirochaetales bacterium]
MKKNYTIVVAAIAALIVLCAFWSCDSGGDDDSPPGDLQVSAGEQVYNKDGTEYKPGSVQTVRTTSERTGASYAALTIGSIDADGKLTLNLPVFTQWGEIGGGTVTDLTADPPDVKAVVVDNFVVAGKEFQNRKNPGGRVINYTYADRDAHIYGQSAHEEGGQQEFNLILKKGWNSTIVYFPPDFPVSNSTVVTGSPGDGYRWELKD